MTYIMIAIALVHIIMRSTPKTLIILLSSMVFFAVAKVLIGKKMALAGLTIELSGNFFLRM